MKLTNKILLFIIVALALSTVMTSCYDLLSESHTHNFGDWEVKLQASCTQDGVRIRYCNCGETQTEVMVKTGHSFGEWKTIIESTCTQDGVEERVCSCGEKESQILEKNSEHSALMIEYYLSNVSTPYADLYALYNKLVEHTKENSCDIDYNQLLPFMLLGEWMDEGGNYIKYTFAYTDYFNTVGSAWYESNLSRSFSSSNLDYYYYLDVLDDKLVIGYQHKITGDKVDNYLISFKPNGIEIFNLNDNITYNLTLNNDYNKVQMDNAKTAYIYIATHINSFRVPSSVKVLSCYVDYQTKTVYAKIQAQNSYGVIKVDTYKLYEESGMCYIEQGEYSFSTNIDLDELNKNLQVYLSGQ